MVQITFTDPSAEQLAHINAALGLLKSSAATPPKPSTDKPKAPVKAAAPADDDDLMGDDDADAPVEITLEMLKASMAPKVKEKKQEKIRAIFTKYGAANVTEVKATDYAAVKSAIDKL